MTQQLSTEAIDLGTDAAASHRSPDRRRWFVPLAVGAVTGLLVGSAVALVATSGDDDSPGVTADVNAQGGEGPVHGEADARLIRRLDGLVASIDTATPVPGSYQYPTADMTPPANPHPAITPGDDGAPETFTLWMFVFNNPDLCTDDCNDDDLGADTPAQGGVFQIDGRIADDERLVMSGSVRVGQESARGATLLRPTSAEVYLAIAPHGRALGGEDLWRQLNGPVGNPELWWGAAFSP